MPASRVDDRIGRALADGRLVTVTRRKGWDRLDGSIVARSPRWLLLALEVEAGFGGHAFVRASDVRRVRRQPSTSFVPRALELEGHWPLPGLDGVDLSSTRKLLRSLAERRLLLAVYYEQDHPDETQIGVPRTFGRRRFRLRTVDPAATWETQDSVFRYRSVSRIDVGSAYERRLAAVAGPAPSAGPTAGSEPWDPTRH